ncbi:MAG: hypothetical protein FRX48_05173 [Lasallia pustulata]|uniref:Uncharacterized protein n=1 Tax=Lasallia pustulata TaxID=136370 RepID=A0A5M8PN32_9LECA|nr:MAG: hypothetical protein FRX48_05173 [Lasallia pustulata]
MAWFWRGFQSAVFYYVSCAPCAKLAHQRKRHKEAQRSRANDALNVSEEPGFYNHPTPFSTNMYWGEEILLGPGPPTKRERKSGNRRDLNSGGKGSSTGSSTVVGGPSEEVLERMEGRPSGDGWNRKRYQREDELLWGVDGPDDGSGPMPGLSGTVTSRSGGNYYIARNPAVNDLHPPVVSSQPTHRRETKWMLQPPPSAKVMEGKERANRSRSGSGVSNGSSKRNVDSMSLGRQIGERFVEEKVKRGELPPTADSAPLAKTESKDWGATNGSIEGLGQRHDRDPRPSSDSQTSSTSSARRTHPHPSPSPKTANPDPHPLPPLPFRPPPPPTAPLAAIASSSTLISSASRPQLPTFHSTIPTSDYPSPSPAHALQELRAPSSTVNARPGSRTRLPEPTKPEECGLRLPECETWFPGREFSFLPGLGMEGEREREGEGVRVPLQRWSMEI